MNGNEPDGRRQYQLDRLQTDVDELKRSLKESYEAQQRLRESLIELRAISPSKDTLEKLRDEQAKLDKSFSVLNIKAGTWGVIGAMLKEIVEHIVKILGP